MMLKRGEKKNEDRRSTKKLGSLIGNREDILRRKQRSTAALHNLNSIWIRKNRIREHVQVKLYKTVIKKTVLMNNS